MVKKSLQELMEKKKSSQEKIKVRSSRVLIATEPVVIEA